jgi:muconolactone delta-isomerase
VQPGEWRTLELFAADDRDRLDEVLASMPLRVWRSDEVTPLAAHPNDPARTSQEEGAAEFLGGFSITVPDGTPSQAVDEANAREANRAHELAEQGHLLRLWMLPGEGHALGLWRAKDATDMQAILESLPLYGWMTVETTPLTKHPNDPALVKA